jgi:hypothetical protein
VLEVSSGEFDAVHTNKFQAPKIFSQQLWNKAGPTVDSMMIQLTMIKENFDVEEAGIPFGWMGVSKELCVFLDKGRKGYQSSTHIHQQYASGDVSIESHRS